MLLLVDTYNLWHTTRTRRNNSTVVYPKMIEYIMNSLNEPTTVEQIAYIVRLRNSDPFIKFFQRELGFFVKMKDIRPSKADNFDVELTIDALKSAEETIVICSSSKNLIPLIQTLQAHRKTVYVFGSGIPREIHSLCIARELPVSVLEKPETETPNESTE